MAFTVGEAEAAAKKLGGSVVVKAQIHAGGRGKGGGVKVAKDAAKRREIAEQDSRHDADHASDRTGRPAGAAAAGRRDAAHRRANSISASCSTARTGKPVFMASSAGGMEIEEVAAKTPEPILKEAIEPGFGLAAVSGAQAGVRHWHSGARA